MRFDPVEYLKHETVHPFQKRQLDGIFLGVPSNDNLFRVHLVMKFVHSLVVFHIHCDLFSGLAVENGKR